MSSRGASALSRPALLHPRRDRSLLRPRGLRRRDGRPACGDPLPRRARHLGQRQVLAGQDRPPQRAGARASAAGRLELADRRIPPGRPPDPQSRRSAAPRRRADPAGQPDEEEIELLRAFLARGPRSLVEWCAAATCRRAPTCCSSSTSSRSCSATRTMRPRGGGGLRRAAPGKRARAAAKRRSTSRSPCARNISAPAR